LPQLGLFERVVQSTTGAALSGVDVTVYREGATVNGSQSGTSPFTVTVRDNGKIKSSDTVFVATVTGTTYNVDSTTDTTVVLSGFGGTLAFSGGERIVPSNNLPTLYGDDQGGASVANPIQTGATGRVQAFAAVTAYDVLVSGGVATTTLYAGIPVVGEHLGGVRYAEQFVVGSSTGGIQEAVNDLPSGGGVVFVAAGTLTPSVGITVPADVEVIGSGRSTIITKGFNGDLFTLAGARSGLKNVRIDGNKGTFTGDAVAVTSADGAEVLGCHIHDAASLAIDIENSDQVRIEGNRISGCNGGGVFAENNSDDLIVRGNFISSITGSTDADCIAVHGTTGTANRPIIEDNSLVAGPGAFGVEIGAFGGSTVLGPIVRGNTCIGGGTHLGGYSIGDATTGGCVEGNYYNANGQTGILAGVEIIAASGVVVANNSIVGGSTLVAGIGLDRSSDCVMVKNVIDGFNVGAALGRGIYVGTSTASTNARRNRVQGNKIIAAGTGTGHGIWVQSNSAGADVSDNQIIDNDLRGIGNASSDGIRIENNTGTLAGTVVRGNKVTNWGTGVRTNVADQDETTIAMNDLRGNTTAIINDNTTTTRMWANILAANQAGPALGSRTQNITAVTNTLVPNGGRLKLTADASYTLTSAPTIADGVDGEEIEIMNVDTVDVITLQDQGTLPSSNLRLAASTRALGPRDNIRLRYDSVVADWVEIGFVNVT